MDFFGVVANVAMMVFWFLVILIPLVIIHELGHTLMAKLVKVRVVEFGVGIPPRTSWAWRWRKMLWSINWLPVGGFAKIYGDHDALDNGTNTALTDKVIARELYRRERLIEVLDSDIEAVLDNNGVEYSDNWKRFEKIARQYKLRELTQDNKDTSEELKRYSYGDDVYYTASKRTPTQEEQEIIQSHLNQLVQLIDWEFEGQKNTKKAFFNRGFISKFLILIGGVLFNYIFAWIMIFILLNSATIPKTYITQSEAPQVSHNFVLKSQQVNPVIGVVKDSALDKAGVAARAKMIAYNGKKTEEFQSFEQFKQEVQSTQGKPVKITYVDPKTKQESTREVSAVQSEKGTYQIGAVLMTQSNYAAKDFGSSFAAATEETNSVVKKIWEGLGRVFTGLVNSAKGSASDADKEALNGVGGPIMIAGFGSLTYDMLGTAGILYLIALISLSLAVFNLLPLPVLDGGRIVIALLQKVTGNRNRKLEAILINVTMLLMLLLFVLIAFRDINIVRSIMS